MAERYRRQHRQPLAELPNTANTPPAKRAPQLHKVKRFTESPHGLPHNVSLEGNGSLAPRSNVASPENHRLSRITNDDALKRNSAISTTSTTASGQKRKTFIGHWQLGATIGKGGCSHVRAVRHRFTRQLGAVKIIARETAENTRAQSLANLIDSTKSNTALATSGYKPIPFGLEREIALMKLLDHKNIVKLYDVWENRNELYLIMEHCPGGELFHYVEQRRGLDEIETIVIFRQIVAALLYCHRLHICHRDLKPENILLNHLNLEVKLIDFGMAALQPEGRQLSTPCGSPHYAAPEVVSAKPYDGKSADTWSCGVILYVMLTGTTPYNYSQDGDVRKLFADICRARYMMPPGLSIEAQDLIKRIFVPDVRYRITLDEVFDHPLLHKYDRELGLEGQLGSKEHAIGPVPKLEDWTVKKPSDVNREILRNMRTLWHSEPESGLMSKLLNKEVNQEKIFYAALVKHQEDHLENFISDYDSMGYSTSDYHHSRAPPPPRSQSQYSILNDEHLRPSHSFVNATPSLHSYEPYKSSREAVVPGSRTTSVRRNESLSTARASVRQQHNSLRVGMLKQRSLYNSSSSLARSRTSLHRSSASKQSLTSNWPSSPPVIATMRPSELHRKGVKFNHLRRSSTPKALASSEWASTRSPATPQSSSRPVSNVFTVPESSSPEIASEQIIRSKKAKAVETLRVRPRKNSETPSQAVRSEIRKHSMELEKACEEAFFRTAGSSSSPAAQSVAGTPPSSVSMRTPKKGHKPRALPTLPDDTPTTFLTRTLKEFRAKLASYRPPEDTEDATFGEVLQLIDDLVPGGQQRQPRRFASAPESHIPDHLGLPIISEESNSEVQPAQYRSATAPVQRGDDTVRLVPPSPSTQASHRKQERDSNRPGLAAVDSVRRQRSHEANKTLRAIDENAVLTAAPAVTARKGSMWVGFAKKITGKTPQDAALPGDPNSVAMTDVLLQEDISAVSSEFPMRRKPVKRGIGKWLGKKDAAETTSDTMITGSMESLFSASSPSPSVNRIPVIDRGRSWFARFLNIKPAQKLVCFSIPRSRARQELILLLKEWQRHGIRDLQYSKEHQIITARVDKHNSLDIKPVSFRIEIFVVLEHERRVGLSLARFTQTKGAASGFRKVLEVVHGVMLSRGWLVENEDKWKAMCEVVEGY